MKNCKNGGKTIIYLKDGPGSDPGDLCQIGELLKKKIAAQDKDEILNENEKLLQQEFISSHAR
jgi:hypothetical protein